METNPTSGNEANLDQYILKNIREICQMVGIARFSPTGVRWSWCNATPSFERPASLEQGQVILFRGLQTAFGIEDWKPLLCYSLIRSMKRKNNTRKFLIELLLPILAFLVAVPLFLPAWSILDVALGLPLLIVGLAIMNIAWSRQARASDAEVAELLGKEYLLSSLKALEAYLTSASTLENIQKLNELAAQEYQSSTGKKLSFSFNSLLRRSLADTKGRIRSLQQVS